MKNNWQLQPDDGNLDYTFSDFDDYGYGELHSVSIGDEIESDFGDVTQYGVVIGIIRTLTGEAACFKVWRQEENGGQFDYIEASKVTMCEPCGSSEWSLNRIGYETAGTEDAPYFYNPNTKDVIRW